MYYLRCTHPPGGATALFAVIGGESIHDLGYQYVLTPVLLNAVVLVLIAFLFNYAFPSRKNPAQRATPRLHMPIWSARFRRSIPSSTSPNTTC